jgi:hypothetical protein
LSLTDIVVVAPVNVTGTPSCIFSSIFAVYVLALNSGALSLISVTVTAISVDIVVDPWLVSPGLIISDA